MTIPQFEVLFNGYPLFFTIFLMTLAAMVVVELLGFLAIGHSPLSQGLDQFFDTLDIGGFDWFRIQDLPGSVVLYSFLYGFSGAGLLLMLLVLPQNTLSFVVALIVSAITGAASVKVTSLALGPLFKAKTHAVSEKSLIGQLVEIKDARCARGFCAEAKIKSENPDLLNTYVMVEPVEDDDSYKAGQTARIVAQQGHIYLVS